MKIFSIALISLFTLLVISLLVARTNASQKNQPNLTEEDLKTKREEIVEEFLHGWNGYKKSAWGEDELKPISQTGSNFIHSSATIVSSIDTLMIMGIESEVELIKDFVSKNYTINTQFQVSTFETNIRIIGGFLSAYTLSNERIYLDKAEEVAESILPMFNTQSNISYIFFSPSNPNAFMTQASLASAGTLQLEFCYLSLLTNKPVFCEKARHFYSVIEELKHSPTWNKELYPLVFNTANPPLIEDTSIGIDARAGSFYEYLVKMWVWSDGKDQQTEKMWRTSIKEINSLLINKTSNNKYTYIGKKNDKSGYIPEMEHLTCFYGGLLVLINEFETNKGLPTDPTYISLAHEIASTCNHFYQLSPQFVSADSYLFNNESFSPSNVAYYLRPETMETLFYLWRSTHNPIYREWGWSIFKSIKKSCRVANGYSGISNVNIPFDSKYESNEKNPYVNNSTTFFTDKQEAFLFSETWKYAYLLFSNDSLIPLEHFIFNTEAHPFLKQKSYRQHSGVCLNCNKYYHSDSKYNPPKDEEFSLSWLSSQTIVATSLLSGILFVMYLYLGKRGSSLSSLSSLSSIRSKNSNV